MSLLDHYWTLASDDPSQRIEAAEALIKGLLDTGSESDWDYALNRLITGLSSTRGSARLGFSMALAEILNTRKSQISISDYLEKTSKAFVVTGSTRGAEERGLLFGKLFALQTLAKSPLWETASLQDFKEFINMALALSLKKVWLREPVFYAICELVQSLSGSFDRDEALEFLFTKIHENSLTATCEGIAIALSVSAEERSKFNDLGEWKTGNPLAKGNLTDLARILKDLPVGTNDSQRSNWKPSVHFVWHFLLKEFAQAENSVEELQPRKKHKKDKKDKKGKKAVKQNDGTIALTEFWRSTVDDGFFANSASPERKMWGFEIFILGVSQLDNVSALLTPNLTRSLANQLAQSDRYLHKMAKRVVSVLMDISRSQHTKAAAIVESLLSHIEHFDRISKSTLVHDLIPLAADQDRLTTMFLKAFRENKDQQPKAQSALDSIIHMMKSSKNTDDIAWIRTVLDELVPIAYFESDMPESMVEMVQQRITSILSHTLGRMIAPTGSWPYEVLRIILDLQQKGQNTRVTFEGDIAKTKLKAEATVERIHKKRVSSPHVDSPQLQAFELLFSMVLLQLYSSNTEAVTLLDELQMVYSKFAGRQQVEDDDEDYDASQVLTEVIISFLAQQSALLRKLSEEVWASFTNQITTGSLQLLYNILGARESLEGQEELFDIEDDEVEGEDEDEDMEDEEEMSESESESESEEESEGETPDEENAVDEEAERALAQTLGVNQDDDDDEEEEEEDSMDDEQMIALDGQLAAIFKDRQNQLSKSKVRKQEVQKAKQNVTYLKSRVLDLLDIYVRKQPSNLDGLSMAIPILEMIRTTNDRQIGDKAREFLKTKLCRKTTYALEGEEDLELAITILRSVLEEAAASTSKAHGLAANQVGVLVTKLLVSYDAGLIEIVSAQYMRALNEWFKSSKNQTTPNMFIDMINYLASKRGN